jgi:serine/threonine-protein kinase
VAATDPFGLAGQVFDGQFRVDHYVGEGGFSVVYRGTHVGLSEPIAVKCLKLPPALGSALVESFIKRFRDESRLHYKLSQGHLHIARSIASGTTVAPATSALVPYTVLEWLEGRSLAEELEERRARGLTGRPLAQVVKLLDSAIDALAYAHAQGVVHRDLNPGNLFLTRTTSGMKLKVLDFGVAKVMADSVLAMGAAARTFGNMRIFTPSYGAPEQFDERIGAIGPWTDVYAVALLVVEALTDRSVMDGEHIGELAAKALNPIQRPTPRALGVSIGDEVEGVLARAVALAPGERPRDAGELWGMLKHAMAADEASARSPHGVSPRRSSAAATLRMAESVPAGGFGRMVEVGPSAVTSSPQRSHSFGGTLRMSELHRVTPTRISSEGDPPEPSDDGPADAPPVSVGMRTRARSTRMSVIIAVVLAILVLGALAAAWFLAPQAHAAIHASMRGGKQMTHRSARD